MHVKTKKDQQIGAPVFAINLVSIPPRATSDRIAEVQDRIQSAVPEGTVFRSPADSLHLSVFQFVWARGSKSNQEAIWRQLQNDVVGSLDSAVSEIESISLISPILSVTPAAIILIFQSSPAVERLRESITGFAEISRLEYRQPQIQHVTLFRFETEASLVELVEVCENMEVSVPAWNVKGLELVEETVYPSLKRRTICSFAVGKSV